MKKKLPVSIVVSSFNEEEKIKDCLSSVSLADEIILVDGTSTDKTIEIAKEFTKKIFIRQNHPMLNKNKNFGFSKAQNKWVLSIDADERVSPELIKEIGLAIQNDEIAGYFLPRKNMIFGKWIEHAGWYPDFQLRLFQKRLGKFPEKHVHELVEVQGKVQYLKGHIIHFNYDTVSQFVRKAITIYVPNEAESLVANGYKFFYLDAIRFPAREFMSRFFAREGYKDGFHGLMLSLLMAFYHFLIFATIWEKQSFPQVVPENILPNLEKEFRAQKKDMRHWLFQAKITATQSPAKKLIYRFLRKVSS